MALVLTLLRAAHARGTHHYLALDALDGLAAPSADAWRRLFYKHIAFYVDGAKAPDTAFKDFKNHVLHPRDGFWGGAPEQAETWYGELVAALQKQDWPAAAYNAGVLSHYCTDPCMPLHTHQTTAESNIHAALEWTVSKSYARLIAIGATFQDTTRPAASTSAGWLGDLLRSAATQSTKHYETLLAHYDIKRGVVAPEEGLDLVGQRATARMLVHARDLVGIVIDRAIAEARVTPVDVGLAADALKAFVTMPKSWWQKRWLDASERQVIEAMYDELMATGVVSKSLRDDDRRIQELYQAEVTALASAPSAHAAKNTTSPSLPVELHTVPTVTDDDPNADAAEVGDAAIARGTRLAVERARPAPRNISAPTPRTYAAANQQAVSAANVTTHVAASHVAPVTAALPVALTNVGAVPVDVPAAETAAATQTLSTYRPAQRESSASLLAVDAEIVDAPSIGPKTAARLNAVGIDTVADFLKAHPIALASRLEASHLTPEVLTAWQEQTRLMTQLPDMRANQAQLLVGAGYRTLASIADADPDTLCADVLHFALSTDGRRILREGRAPDIEQIVALARSAREIKAA